MSVDEGIEKPVNQRTRNNHFVPQWYLKQWATRSGKVWVYRLLVSDSRVNIWEQRSPRGVAFHRDLYTSLNEEGESDDFEKWLEQEFEAPAQIAISRLLRDETLGPDHWQHLGRYAMCQQLRTPQDFVESMQRWDVTLPGLMEDTLVRTVRNMEALHDAGLPLSDAGPKPQYGNHFSDAVRVTVRPAADPETGQGEIGVEVTLGRDLWIRQQKHLLEGVGKLATLHKWSIATPARDSLWFTSDQPVARLNYSNEGFDLGGGWGCQNGHILMPLSPRHLLFTQIGTELPERVDLSEEQTTIITKVLAARAYRAVFADRRRRDVEHLRPRTVDAAAYKQESDAWEGWHDQQSSPERRSMRAT